jgi:hypothetical protein
MVKFLSCNNYKHPDIGQSNGISSASVILNNEGRTFQNWFRVNPAGVLALSGLHSSPLDLRVGFSTCNSSSLPVNVPQDHFREISLSLHADSRIYIAAEMAPFRHV